MSNPLLKDRYSPAFYQQFTEVLKKVIPGLNQDRFTSAIFNDQWEALELKQRMHHTAIVLHDYLSADFPRAARQLVTLVEALEAAGMTTYGLEFIFIPHYVELYGQEYFEESVGAMERITQLTSCEFAVRPFIVHYEQEMMQRMQGWTAHEHEEVRRLASEGCRPRLPWAMALPRFKKDPSLILPVLEALKTDESLYVRRSVANNLNDISKDNPEVALDIFRAWQGIGEDTDWIIKHGCRTLLKAGLPEAMALFDYAAPEQIEVRNVEIPTSEIEEGGTLSFSFSIANTTNKELKVRMEYGMYFLRANGKHSKKVFMIAERNMAANEVQHLERTFSFRPITTRRYYPGQQGLAIIINGQEVYKTWVNLSGQQK
jgi:3-methyladenine DNA glycosylase AlkC